MAIDPPVPPAHAVPTLMIVSGMSGSGKSVALNTLEDLGFYCVDTVSYTHLTLPTTERV